MEERLCSYQHDFDISAEWKNASCDALVEQLKQHVAKQSLQRSLNNQILDYKAILDLCENEMMSIRFFGICKESMISVENLEIEKWYEGGDTVPVTQSSHTMSHHVLPLSSSRNGPWAYAICVYNSFWWVGRVSLVDIAASDIIILISCILIGQDRPLISINVVTDVMFLWKTLFKRCQLHLVLLQIYTEW